MSALVKRKAFVDVMGYQNTHASDIRARSQLYLFEATDVAKSLTETSAENNVYKFTADYLLSYGIELQSPSDAYCTLSS